MQIKVEELKNCKRILVIGNSGSGKSTFSRLLGDVTGIEVYHLDKYFWTPGWVMKKKTEFEDEVKKILINSEWIIDGNFSGTIDLRAKYADKIFQFDFPDLFCVYRILKRSVKSKFGMEKRVDMADGCNEKWFDWDFVKFVYNFKRDYLPRTIKALNEINFDKRNLITFMSYREANRYAKKLEKLPKSFVTF